VLRFRAHTANERAYLLAPDREAQIDDILHAQREIWRAMRESAEPAWLELDLTMGQVKGLYALSYGGAMTVGHLAEALGIGKPAASILVDRLVHLALVERDEDRADRRRTLVRLSGRGEELVLDLRQGRRERVRQWASRLADADLAALRRGLRALAAVAGGPVGEEPALRTQTDERTAAVVAGQVGGHSTAAVAAAGAVKANGAEPARAGASPDGGHGTGTVATAPGVTR
jgi:DNA-binding MarR family transcriptional regulator